MLCPTFITLLRHSVYATAIRGEELPNSEENPLESRSCELGRPRPRSYKIMLPMQTNKMLVRSSLFMTSFLSDTILGVGN